MRRVHFFSIFKLVLSATSVIFIALMVSATFATSSPPCDEKMLASLKELQGQIRALDKEIQALEEERDSAEEEQGTFLKQIENLDSLIKKRSREIKEAKQRTLETLVVLERHMPNAPLVMKRLGELDEEEFIYLYMHHIDYDISAYGDVNDHLFRLNHFVLRMVFGGEGKRQHHVSLEPRILSRLKHDYGDEVVDLLFKAANELAQHFDANPDAEMNDPPFALSVPWDTDGSTIANYEAAIRSLVPFFKFINKELKYCRCERLDNFVDDHDPMSESSEITSEDDGSSTEELSAEI